MWRFSTRSIEDDILRAIQEKKFYTTLPHYIDNEVEKVEEYLAATEEAYEAEYEFWEQLDGETALGGEMRLSYKPKDDTTS